MVLTGVSLLFSSEQGRSGSVAELGLLEGVLSDGPFCFNCLVEVAGELRAPVLVSVSLEIVELLSFFTCWGSAQLSSFLC